MDGRDLLLAQPRGWTRYARDLAAGMASVASVDFAVLSGARFRGPEVLWELAGLPVAARGFDVVHAPNVFLPLLRRCAGVVTIHDLAFEAFPDDFSARTGAKFRWLAPRAARSAERVVCVSAFTRDDVCARYGVDPARVVVVPNAPSLAVGTAPVPAGTPYVLGVGDLRAKKNWVRLSRAWRASGVAERLVIAGVDAGVGAELRTLGVECPGWVDDASLDALMRGAAALVHPSLYEGFGLVVVEAMARGVPVAAATGTALPEAAGGAAVLFDPLDEDAIGAALLSTLTRAEELRAAGLARAAELSWERSAALTAAAYHDAAADR